MVSSIHRTSCHVALFQDSKTKAKSKADAKPVKASKTNAEVREQMLQLQGAAVIAIDGRCSCCCRSDGCRHGLLVMSGFDHVVVHNGDHVMLLLPLLLVEIKFLLLLNW